MTQPAPRRRVRLDEHWLRSVGLTVALVGLVAGAIGGGWAFIAAAVAVCAAGFGFFYLMIPGGAHFGMTVANFLAVYACAFAFFREANFPLAPDGDAIAGLALPLTGFLGGCIVRRRQMTAILRTRMRVPHHFPVAMRWLAIPLVLGAASFAVPALDLPPAQQGLLLLAWMALIGVLVAASVRQALLVMREVAVTMQSVSARFDEIAVPMMTFLTVYALIVVVFACLFRIVDQAAGAPVFSLHGTAARISFGDSLYFSLAALTTLGIGDIAPVAPLVRALTALEVVSGVLMLLFGFSEIMQARRPQGR
jgi:hypothetical protein